MYTIITERKNLRNVTVKDRNDVPHEGDSYLNLKHEPSQKECTDGEETRCRYWMISPVNSKTWLSLDTTSSHYGLLSSGAAVRVLELFGIKTRPFQYKSLPCQPGRRRMCPIRDNETHFHLVLGLPRYARQTHSSHKLDTSWLVQGSRNFCSAYMLVPQ